jgi:hypothetical protein
MPIYRVTYEIELVIEAESLDDATEKTAEAWSSAKYEIQADYSDVSEVRSINGLPHGWDGKCLPYLGDGKLRLEELLPE